MLGGKLRELRESNGYVQRQIAAILELDTAYISKMENGDKQLSRDHLKKLSQLFHVSEKELLTLWLADKILRVINDEPVAKEALDIVVKVKKNHG